VDVAVPLLVSALGGLLVARSAQASSYLDGEVGGRDVPVFRIVRTWMTHRAYVAIFGVCMIGFGCVALLASA
jgi:hypothetical protein